MRNIFSVTRSSASWPISPTQVATVVIVFLFWLVFFGVLSATVGWPDSKGWPLALLAASIISLLPLLGPLLLFLQRSGAVLDIRGFKIDLSGAPRVVGTEPKELNLQQDPGQQVTDSNAASIADAAAVARDAQIVVVDLGTGRSWYPSRLFALAAAAHELGGAAGIVLLAQRGGVPRRFVGWIPPADLVQAMIQADERYRDALSRAQVTLHHTQFKQWSPNYVVPAEFTGAVNDISTSYRTQGELAFVPALVNAMQTQPEIEVPNAPFWLRVDDAERLFDAWLVRDRVSSAAPDHEIIEACAQSRRQFIAIEEDGQYLGMVDIDSFLRRLVLRLADFDTRRTPQVSPWGPQR